MVVLAAPSAEPPMAFLHAVPRVLSFGTFHARHSKVRSGNGKVAAGVMRSGKIEGRVRK